MYKIEHRALDYGVGILFHGGNLIAVLVTLALFLTAVLVGNPYFKKYHELLNVARAGWRSMAFASIIYLLFTVFLIAYPKPMLERKEYAPTWLVFAGVVLSCYVVFVFSIIKTRQIYEQNKRLEKEKEIYQMAFTDGLTGVYNRTFYQEKISDFQLRKQKLESYALLS